MSRKGLSSVPNPFPHEIPVDSQLSVAEVFANGNKVGKLDVELGVRGVDRLLFVMYFVGLGCFLLLSLHSQIPMVIHGLLPAVEELFWFRFSEYESMPKRHSMI